MKITITSTIFTELLAILFIAFKLAHIINWSWVWVLAPIWVSFAVFILILILLFMIWFIINIF